MSTTGTSASDCGDELKLDATAPAFPQAEPKLGTGDGSTLLLQVGFQVTGKSAEADA